MTSSRQSKDIDRDYLESLQDKFLEALIAHDSAHLPLSKALKHTENTIDLSVGEGLWATAIGAISGLNGDDLTSRETYRAWRHWSA
jgi:hypothetical protein